MYSLQLYGNRGKKRSVVGLFWFFLFLKRGIDQDHGILSTKVDSSLKQKILSHFHSLVQAEELNLSFSFWKLKLEEHIPLMPFQKQVANISPAKGGILMFCKESL